MRRRTTYEKQIQEFVEQAIVETKSVEDLYEIAGTLYSELGSFLREKGIKLESDQTAEFYIGSVGKTKGIPASHKVIISSIAEALGITAELEAKDSSEKRAKVFRLVGDPQAIKAFDTTIRYILVGYDKVAKRAVAEWDVATAVKREMVKQLYFDVADRMVQLVAEHLSSQSSIIAEKAEEVRKALKEQKVKPEEGEPSQKKSSKKSKKAEDRPSIDEVPVDMEKLEKVAEETPYVEPEVKEESPVVFAEDPVDMAALEEEFE